MRFSAITVFILVISLSSCAVVRESLFVPINSPGAIAERGSPCGSFKNRLKYQIDDVYVFIDITRKDLVDSIRIVFDIPAGNVVSIAPSVLKINGQTESWPQPTVYDFLKPVDYHHENLIGNGTRKYRWVVDRDSDLPRTFSYVIQTQKTSSFYKIDEFKIIINGKSQTISAADFELKPLTYTSAINC